MVSSETTSESGARSESLVGGARSVLLTVSGTVPADLREQIASGRRPRADYLEMAERFGADLIDFTEARRRHPRLARLVEPTLGPKDGLKDQPPREMPEGFEDFPSSKTIAG